MTHRDSVREAEDDALALWAKEWQLTGHQVWWLGACMVQVGIRPDAWAKVWAGAMSTWWMQGFAPGGGIAAPVMFRDVHLALDAASEFLRRWGERAQH